MMVTQSQGKSFVLTWIDEYRRSPQSANPYMVLTCFDELCRSKDMALMRGDVISHLSRDEGQIVMEMMMDCYLDATLYEKVRQFNSSPGSFNHEEWIKMAIEIFRKK